MSGATAQGRASDEVRHHRPHRLLYQSEGVRALQELGWYAASSPWLLCGAKGDDHTVLVLPGFMASDTSTRTLRALLRLRGFRPAAWRQGINIGPTPRITQALDSRLADVHAQSGRPVSIVGWSLGGIYARDLARRFPDRVRSVITLGSPLQLSGGDGPQRRETWAAPTYEALSRWHLPDFTERQPEDPAAPLPVPSTSILTKTDGIVPWQTCLQETSANSENIVVPGSHCGLGHNPAALEPLLDRLLQPAGNWQPYAPAAARAAA